MKKLISIFLLTTSLVFAVGPKIPCILTFTPSPSPGVTGYWLYWRTTNGVYVDTQRWAMPTNAGSGYDLRVLGLPKGQYFIAASATNATQESVLSTPDCFWDFTSPNGPAALTVTSPK